MTSRKKFRTSFYRPPKMYEETTNITKIDTAATFSKLFNNLFLIRTQNIYGSAIILCLYYICVLFFFQKLGEEKSAIGQSD